MSNSAMRLIYQARLAVWLIAICGYFNAALAVAADRTNPAPDAAESAVVLVELASIDAAYADAEFVFNLVGDKKGFRTFKETSDVFLTGVETAKPCDIRIFASADGLQTIASLPVASDAEFKKFLRNLWDIDVKSAPPPESSQMPQVPAAVRKKLSSLKLERNERLLFGLSDGFVRYESGHVFLGETLEAVRRAHNAHRSEPSRKSTLALRIDGKAASPDRRHGAFEKSKERALSRLKKNDQDSEAGFALQKALFDHQLNKFGLLFAETEHADINWSTSHAKKQSAIHAEFAPAEGTSLAKDFGRLGETVDEFAGVSRQDAVLSSSINAPVNGRLGKSFKGVIHQAREFAHERIDRASKLEQGQKSIDRDFADLAFDLADDVAGQPFFNGFLRTWSNGDGTLTTVGAGHVSDVQKFEERIQKFAGREAVGRKGSGDAAVSVHKIAVQQWRQDYQELFDKDGSVFLGTSRDALWYAIGENSLERLEQAIHEAEGKTEGKHDTAVDIHAEMRPLADVWAKIHARNPNGPARQVAEKSKDGEKSRVARAASNVADLNLPKIAAEAYHGGKDTVALSLKREGDKAVLSAHFDEGTLRFLGKALSKFVKDNLED